LLFENTDKSLLTFSSDSRRRGP